MVTIIKQSGNPVDEGDAKAFLEEWKEGFDKLFDAEGNMAVVTEKAQEYEQKLKNGKKVLINSLIPKEIWQLSVRTLKSTKKSL